MIRILNTNEIQAMRDENQNLAIELLEALKRNENISRWDAYSRRHDINRILDNSDDYDEVMDEMRDIIESAKESL